MIRGDHMPPRKPISVWIGQLLIALMLAVFTGSYIYHVVLAWRANFSAIASHPWALARFLVTVAGIGFVGWVIVLISRRSPFGRWFGLLLLVLMFAVSVVASLDLSSSALPTNDAQRAGYLVGEALGLVLFLILLWRFGFSRASRAYFSRQQAASA
jgi:hypothetical protein